MSVRSPSRTRTATGPCYRCGEEGHFRRERVRPLNLTPPHTRGGKELGQVTSAGGRVSQWSQSPTVQVSCTTNRGPSLQIALTVNGIPVQAVVETGAEMTILSESLYQRFPVSEQTALKKTLLWNAELGKDMTAMGGLKLTFQICTRSFEWEVYMVPIHDTFLLSVDLLRAANVTIHANGSLHRGGTFV